VCVCCKPAAGQFQTAANTNAPTSSGLCRLSRGVFVTTSQGSQHASPPVRAPAPAPRLPPAQDVSRCVDGRGSRRGCQVTTGPPPRAEVQDSRTGKIMHVLNSCWDCCFHSRSRRSTPHVWWLCVSCANSPLAGWPLVWKTWKCQRIIQMSGKCQEFH